MGFVGLLSTYIVLRAAHPGAEWRPTVGDYGHEGGGLPELNKALTGVNTFTRRYLVHPPRLEAALEDERVAGVSAIIQNAAPYTYFGSQPVEMAEGASLSSGDLAGLVLERARPTDIPTIIWRALSKSARVTRHRHVHAFSGVRKLPGLLEEVLAAPVRAVR